MKNFATLLVLTFALSLSVFAQDGLPDNIMGAGIRADFSFQNRPKVAGSYLLATKAGDNYYTFNTVDVQPAIVKSGGKSILTLQTVPQAGVAPVVYRFNNRKGALFLIGQAGAAFRPSFAGGAVGVASGIATSIAASTGFGVGHPLPGKFSTDHNLLALAAVRYTFTGGGGATSFNANQVVVFIGKGF